jgi:hypothetical protein
LPSKGRISSIYYSSGEGKCQFSPDRKIREFLGIDGILRKDAIPSEFKQRCKPGLTAGALLFGTVSKRKNPIFLRNLTVDFLGDFGIIIIDKTN